MTRLPAPAIEILSPWPGKAAATPLKVLGMPKEAPLLGGDGQ